MVALLGISGSLRRESFNTKLLREASRAFGECHFAMADLNLPLFNEDLEAEGVPDKVALLMAQIEAADGLVISTPEYNKAPSGALKNAFDWISRKRPMPTAGKPTVILSAAAGIAGGQRSQAILHLMLQAFDLRYSVNPEFFMGQAFSKFGEDGRITDEKTFEFLQGKMAGLREMIG